MQTLPITPARLDPAFAARPLVMPGAGERFFKAYWGNSNWNGLTIIVRIAAADSVPATGI